MATSKSVRRAKTRRASTKNTDKARLRAIAEGARLKRIGDNKEVDLSKYATVKSAGGNTSLDCGDTVAKKLRGKELDDVYKEAARVLGRDMADALRKRYADLNPGMQRMNLGNKIRHAGSGKAA